MYVCMYVCTMYLCTMYFVLCIEGVLKTFASKTQKTFVGPKSQLILHDSVKEKYTWLCMYIFRQHMANVQKSRYIVFCEIGKI
jgi:hypothetical protein